MTTLLRCGALLVLIVSAQRQRESKRHGSITQKTQNRIVLCFTVKLGMLFASWSAASQVFSRCQKVEEVACAVAPQNQILCFSERCKKCGVVCAECAGVEIDCSASIELAKSFTQPWLHSKKTTLLWSEMHFNSVNTENHLFWWKL